MLVVAVLVVVVAGGAVALLRQRSPAPAPAASARLVAEGVAGVSDAALLDVEARLVGGAAVADPSTGRLPDVAAFHRAGLQTMRISGGRLMVEFLPNATTARRQAARAAMLRSPAIATVYDASSTSRPPFEVSALTTAIERSVTSGTGQPGVIVMASTPQRVWAFGAGVADVATKLPMSPALPYRIGSTTKTLTAVVVLQLASEGRITLDAPVSTYLPGVLPYREPITVRQLLAHTSGLVDTSHFGALNIVPERDVPRTTDPVLRAEAMRALAAGRAGRQVPVSAAVQVAVAVTRPLAFTPGSRFTYSNTDYLVLTLLIEKIAGRALDAEYRTRIFAPLKMTDTFLARTAAFPGPHVHSYATRPDGSRVDASDDIAMGPSGSGTVVSTAADLTTFFRALFGGRLLSPAMLGQMMTTTPQSAMSPVMDAYGLGITRYATPCGSTAWGHGGAIGGYVTDVYASPSGDTVAVFAENATDRPDLRDALTGTLFCAALAR